MKRVLLFLLLTEVCWGASSNFYTLIKRLGLTPMNTAPKELQLKDVKGSEQRLSSLKGNWILLNFWATWCGPCQEEMPSLEVLSKTYSKLKVIGVAVDGKDKSGVRKFLNRKGITFPIWLDDKGVSSSVYQANSIPMAYLISPDWKIVGFMAGAQDWQAVEIINIFGELLGEKAAPAELPEEKELPPPIVSIKAPNQIKAGKVFNLEVLVSWPAENVRYLIRTPKLTLPEGTWLGNISSETKSSVEGGALRYLFPLRVEEVGKVTLGPAEISFGGKEQKVLASSIEIEVIGSWFKWWYLFFLLLPAPLFFVRRGTKKIVETNENPLQERIEKLQREKYSLSPSAYQVELLKTCFALDNNCSDLKLKIERIEYGGELMPPEEVTHYEKKLIKREEDE